MQLCQLIGHLKNIVEQHPDAVCRYGFDRAASYRGYYEDLAFNPATDVPFKAMLTVATDALGATFEGYKGGNYKMENYTDCWLSEWGDASGDGISQSLIEYWYKDAEHGA